MGVRGLLSFINSRREEFFVPMDVSSCKFVIDGNNLRFALYHSCPVRNSCFGGDYKKYYDFVRSYFERLVECGIDIVVIMDGSFETAKRRTLFERARDQAKTSVRCTPISHHKYVVLPVFAKETFFEAIVDLNIRLIQTLSEADHEIARYAAECNSTSVPCFVISNDSDFCIYNVDVLSLDSTLGTGFISSNDVSKSLPCRKFDRTKFLAYFKIDADKSYLLHIMATLCGNDYVKNSEALNRIFGQIPKMPKGSQKSMSPRHQRMFTLLKWLSRENDTQVALAKLLAAVPKDKRHLVEENLNKSIGFYTIEKGNSVEEKEEDIKTFGGHDINEQIREKYADCKLPNWILDIIVHRLCFLPNQVENVSKISSHDFCLPILKTCCQILLQEEFENSGNPLVVKVVYRRGMTSGMTKLEFQNPLRIDSEAFFNILLVQDPTVQDYLRANEGLDCVILSSFLFWIKSSHDNFESVRELEASAIILALSIAKETTSKQFSEKIYELGKMTRDPKHRFDVDVVHAFANFQAVLYHATLLNKLLGVPFPPPMSMHQWWNGTLMYNLASGILFTSEKDLRDNVVALDKDVLNTYVGIWNFATTNIPELSTLRRDAEKKRRNRKKKSIDILNDVDPDLVFTKSPSDLSNRFSILQTS